jgi:ribonucleoside-triphosphate reductase
MTVSARAAIITRRTYNRAKNIEGTEFETWAETVDRVIKHQRWLWERALTHQENTEFELRFITEDNPNIQWIKLNYDQELELQELRQLILERKVTPSGRTLWLGGTEVGKTREASNFNCSALDIQTIYDVVDAFWLLLQGAGVGFRPVPGTLNGFKKHINELKIIRSKNSTEKGPENNTESYDPITRVWTIKVGDSAEAWAKSVGKLVAGKYAAKTLVLDFSDIRAPGLRLRNYGWISQGDVGISAAYEKIFHILNKRADSLLTAIDILDIINLLGTVLSTRRSAQIAVYDYGDPEWQAFATSKVGIWENGKSHRSQSNNSLFFRVKPSRSELEYIFGLVNAGGNGEPGIINGEAMRRRAPWATLTNPCGEILLPPSGGFCCLVTIDLQKFKDDTLGLYKAANLIARANYRQTVVDFRDGILQEKWHLNNDFLHLCGVSLAGVAAVPEMQAFDYRRLERTITASAYSMAEELGTAYPKNITTKVKIYLNFITSYVIIVK